MKYLHIGLIQIKITGLFRLGIDTPIMIACLDERIINNPLDSLMGGVKLNLANRIFGVTIHPDFCISLGDKYIDKVCSLSISLIPFLTHKPSTPRTSKRELQKFSEEEARRN